VFVAGQGIRKATQHTFQYKISTPHNIRLAPGATMYQFCNVLPTMNKMRISALLRVTLLAFLIAGNCVAQETSTTTSSRKFVYKSSTGLSSFNVEVRGKIELTDDDKDIKSMSADGYLEVSKTVFGSRRALVITPQGSSLKREYYEGHSAVAFEPEGRKWMNEILPELVRTTTIGAESRVNRFYKQGGVPAVLSEINKLDSDHAKAAYASLLMGLNIPGKDYVTIIQSISNTMDSDHYMAEFLQNNLKKFLTVKEATDAVFAACGKIDSDHYKTEVIKEALRSQPPSGEAFKTILTATSKMESDHYKTEVLTTLLKQPNISEPVITELINTSKSIESDYYRSVLLNKALAKPALSNASYQRVLESVKDIESDHYKAEVLGNLLQAKLPPAQIQNLVDISSSIESDHYITQVLNTALAHQDLSDESFRIITGRVANMGSDHYACAVLQSALKSGNISNDKMLSILNAAGHIGSDHYLTEVLLAAAPRVKSGDATLKDAYRIAAKKLDSETYYGRAMKALD
jgi:hypothetical protein